MHSFDKYVFCNIQSKPYERQKEERNNRRMKTNRHMRLLGSGCLFNAIMVLNHTASPNINEGWIKTGRMALIHVLSLVYDNTLVIST